MLHIKSLLSQDRTLIDSLNLNQNDMEYNPVVAHGDLPAWACVRHGMMDGCRAARLERLIG